MAGTKNYERLKEPDTNTTGMSITFQGSELPTAKAALAAGTTGNAEIFVEADADESGGIDIQDLFKVALTPVIANLHPGTMSLTVVVTPIKGDGTDGTPITTQVTHDETMDAWQTAAGRARQA